MFSVDNGHFRPPCSECGFKSIELVGRIIQPISKILMNFQRKARPPQIADYSEDLSPDGRERHNFEGRR